MRDEPAVTHDPVQLARLCLSTGEDLEVVRIHQFADDVEAHDDARQARLYAEFKIAFSIALSQLESVFGSAELADAERDVPFVPLCGVFCAASWVANGKRLYLAAAHEDRECPYLLVVGVEAPA